MRINKYLSKANYCSRREADDLIKQGKVLINGEICNLGDEVKKEDIVLVNGKIIEITENNEYILFNKPVGVTVTTAKHDSSNIIDYIDYDVRIFPVGRLDKDSEGLILLTNDGEIVNKILKSKNNHEKEYIVKVDKKIDKNFLNKMQGNIKLEVGITKESKVQKIDDYSFKIILTQGLNRQIRRMCKKFGYNVIKLKRTRVINLKLGNLTIGNYRQVSKNELKNLFEIIGYTKQV
ncbi:MAG: pseudouridine synthase [Bacillota bacterium]